MFSIRYSQTGRVLRWDRNTFTDCRPCEAEGIEDEIIELASSLTVPSTFYKDTCNLTDYSDNQLPRSLRHSMTSHKGPLPSPSEWTLSEANEKAKKVCQDALNMARNGYDNLQHAKSLYDEYIEKGLPPGLYDLENPVKENSWDPEPEAISWGDESVTDDMCTTNEDGALTVVGTAALFADPYGAELANVVQMTVKVEVIRSESGEEKESGEAKDPATCPVRKE
ncbi:hypothetical protein THAOC_13434 [Thalassiosira oceanica]|uniref:Uncharacterized protein n=1 Tax=Thalassiosira oceanica TaxID=159749 RepID=K0SL68_THAOC|nr:hypothetical protein THAOC_13434 [Thalassiosira oceanica]|eukprot:EJK65684.1 hypothetical protein THAOC_13434 [Thalassiosira oceanica]